MAVAGRKPKPEGQKRNRHKPTHEWVEVEDRPHKGGPKLPAAMPDGRKWPEPTKRWWAVVSAMPHCSLWKDSDWQFAQDTALIAAAFHGGDLRHGNELRQREKILGTTGDARRDLRIRYVDKVEEASEAAGVTSLADYRESI